MNSKYDDILYTSYPFPSKHKRMSLSQRAAQFAPFAALEGYDQAVKDVECQTVERPVLSVEMQEDINRALTEIASVKEPVRVCIEYFEEDPVHPGGYIRRFEGYLKKNVPVEGVLYTRDKGKIILGDILRMEAYL